MEILESTETKKKLNLILHTVGEDMYIRVWEEINLCFSRDYYGTDYYGYYYGMIRG